MKYYISKEYPLRKKLNKLGIPAGNLASMAGVDESYLSLAMNGKRIISEKTMGRIFKAIEKVENDPKIQNKKRRKLTEKEKEKIIKRRRKGEKLMSIAGEFGIGEERVRLLTKDDPKCRKFRYKKNGKTR